MAAYSVLILQASAALAAASAASAAAKCCCKRALLQASVTRCCKQAQFADAARARTIGAKVLIFAATTPYSPRLKLALVVPVVLRLWCWPGGYLRRYEDVRMPSRFGRREFGTRALSDFFYFMYLLFCLVTGRIGQRKNEGADSSGCRAAHRIDRNSACWCFLLVTSAACCCCMLRLLPLLLLLLLLLLLQVGPAAARLCPSCK